MVTWLQCWSCHETAQALYEGHAKFYDLPVQPFAELSVADKERWIERAADVITRVGATPRRGMDDRWEAVVAGVILPDAPWGIRRDEVTR